jgi:protein SCO1/2
MSSRRLQSVLVALAILAGAAGAHRSASAQLVLDSLKDREGVGLVDRIGSMVPLDARLTDPMGRSVRLGDYFDGTRPVLLVPAYLDCPLLCTMVFDRVKAALNEMSWTAGDQFRVVTYSFDHRDTPTKARIKQEALMLGYDREIKDPQSAWAFLVGDAETVRSISTALGYHYKYLPETGEYSHNAAIYFIRPDGTVHNFIEGLEYPADQITLALSEASSGKAGTVFERMVFACYRYDPKTGLYKIHPMTVMRIGGGITAAALVTFLGALWITGRLRKRRDASRAPRASSARGLSDAATQRTGVGIGAGQSYTAAGSTV